MNSTQKSILEFNPLCPDWHLVDVLRHCNLVEYVGVSAQLTIACNQMKKFININNQTRDVVKNDPATDHKDKAAFIDPSRKLTRKLWIEGGN